MMTTGGAWKGRQVAAVWQAAAAGAGHDLGMGLAHAEAFQWRRWLTRPDRAIHHADPTPASASGASYQSAQPHRREVVLSMAKSRLSSSARCPGCSWSRRCRSGIGVGRAHGVGDGPARLGRPCRAISPVTAGRPGRRRRPAGRVADGAAGVHLEGRALPAAQRTVK